MRKFRYPLLAFVFAFGLNVQAKDAPSFYFDPATIDYKALLPNPPAAGSPEDLKEIDLILKEQASRTPEEVARIRQEVHLTVYLFANVLGPWFTKKDLPVTAVMFHKVDENERPVVEAAKKYWDRPRPPQQDKRVHPPIGLPTNASYPSGHSTFSTLNALILAELVPDLKDAVLARGRQIGDDRVLGGVHFPSDVEAGRTLGKALFTALMASPAFQADLARSKAEIAAVRGK